MNMSTFWENPITQKAVAGIIVAGSVAMGGFTISTRDRVQEHELKLNAVQTIQQDLSTIKDTTNSIKTDVAVLKDRAERENKNDSRKDH